MGKAFSQLRDYDSLVLSDKHKLLLQNHPTLYDLVNQGMSLGIKQEDIAGLAGLIWKNQQGKTGGLKFL